MKDFFIKYGSLLIIGSATIIFCLATIMQNIFHMELKDSLSIVIAFIGIFATFGGAYLGAKISGQYTLKSIEEQYKKQQDKVDYIARQKATLAIIKIEDNMEVISYILNNSIESSDERALKSSGEICDNFIIPIKELLETEDVKKASINIYIALSKYIEVGNRLANYSRHSYDYEYPELDNEVVKSFYRDYYLTQEEIELRDNYNSVHHYIAESYMIYNTLHKELELLKTEVLNNDIYNNIHKIDSEFYEDRIY